MPCSVLGLSPRIQCWQGSKTSNWISSSWRSLQRDYFDMIGTSFFPFQEISISKCILIKFLIYEADVLVFLRFSSHHFVSEAAISQRHNHNTVTYIFITSQHLNPISTSKAKKSSYALLAYRQLSSSTPHSFLPPSLYLPAFIFSLLTLRHQTQTH